METKEYNLVNLDSRNYKWFTEVAAVRMIVEEYKEPRLVNPSRINELVDLMLKGSTAWVVEKNNNPIAALGALGLPNSLNPSISCLAEIFWYVLPEHRNGRAASLLLNKFCEESNKYDESSLSLLNDSAAVAKSLKKKGFMLKELGFKK